MDSREIKQILKDARACLYKNPQQTLTLVKKVLKEDNHHYNALLLQGSALFRLEKYSQSLQSYNLAIDVDARNILGWQGVVQVYDRKGVSSTDKHANEEYAKALEALNRFQLKDADGEKHCETALKLMRVHLFEKNMDGVINVLNGLVKARGMNLKVARAGYAALSQIKDKLTPKQLELTLKCLETFHKEDSCNPEDRKKYFSLLFRTEKYKELEKVCMGLKGIFHTFYPPLDYLCRLYVENKLTEEETIEEVPVLIEKLFKLHPTSSFANFARGKYFWKSGQPAEAIGWLRVGLESKFHPDASYIVAQCQLALWDFDGAEDECRNALKNELNPQFKHWFSLLLIEALIGLEKADEALEVLDSLDQTQADPLGQNKIPIYKAQCYHLKGNEEEFNKLCESDENCKLWQFQYISIIRDDQDLKNLGLMDLCDKFPNDFSALLTCGIAFCEGKDYEFAIEIFLKALKIQENHPILMYYIGFVHKVFEDFKTSVKYLARAYKILPYSQLILPTFSDVLFELGLHPTNFKILNRYTKKFKKDKSKWAWMRLGMLHMELGKPSEAAIAYQSAIRSDYCDPTLWLVLGQAYYSRGSLISAFKSFERSVTLGIQCSYAELQMGSISSQLGQHDKAVQILTQLVRNKEGEEEAEAALLELGRIWLRSGRKLVKKGQTLSVIEAVSNSIQFCAKVETAQYQDMALCIMAEAVILGSKLDSRVKSFKIPAHLYQSSGNIGEIVEVGFEDLFTVGINAAKLGLETCRGDGASYHQANLAKLYYRQAQLCNSNTIKLALYHAKKAISLNQGDFKLWTLLGVIADYNNDSSLALHCFLKSMEIRPSNNARVWVDLGFLCLEYKVDSLKGAHEAHRCFGEGQRVQPNYSLSWIGQAQIAEGLQPEDALDLYRHACTLEDTNIHSYVCYAYWVCRLVLNPKEFDRSHADYLFQLDHVDAVHVALEKIALYNLRTPNVDSLIIQGLLQLFVGLYETACTTLSEAMNLGPTKAQQLCIRLGISANQQKLLKFEENYRFVRTMGEIHTRKVRVMRAVGLGCAKVGSYGEAYLAYEILTLMKDKDSLSDYLVAQGITSYLDGDVDMAKFYLFQGCESASSPQGFMALCAIGLETYDISLAQSAIERLDKTFGHAKYVDHYALLKVYCGIIEESLTPEYPVLSCIREYPLNAKLHKILGEYYVNYTLNGTRARHWFLGAEKLGEQLVLAQICFTHLLDGNVTKAYNYAQRALIASPIDPIALAIMVVSLAMLFRTTRLKVYKQQSVKLALKGMSWTFEDHTNQNELTKNDVNDELYQWFEEFVAQRRLES